MKRMLITMFLLAITSQPALAALSNSSDLRWGISVSGFSNLSTATSSPTTAGKTIVVDKAVTVNNKTISGRSLIVTKGGSINVARGKTLIINGSFSSPLAQCFFGYGTVTFGVGSVAEIYPVWRGAKGDGTTDDTDALQQSIDSAPGGGVVNGLSKKYLVKKCNLKSNIVFTNFNLKTAPNAPIADFWTPVTIGAYYDTTVRSNIIIRNVHVDGNRISNKTGIVGSEDGGKHGFRIIGNVSNILIENCSAKYCGSYGILFYRGIGTRTDVKDTPQQSNVTLRNFVSQYNKIHGGAFDSIRHLTIENCIFTYNGHAYSNDPAALFNGKAYANGIDFEGYGIGSWMGDIHISKSDFRFNANNSITFVDTVTQTDAGFRPRKNFSITDCFLDTGTNVTRATPTIALQFSSSIANKSLGALFKNITINGGDIAGEIVFRAVDGVAIMNVLLTSATSYLGVLDYATNILVGKINKQGKSFFRSNSSVVYTP